MVLPLPAPWAQVMADPQLGPFFVSVNVEKLKSHQVCCGEVGGGPNRGERCVLAGAPWGVASNAAACVFCRVRACACVLACIRVH